jgi:hypothetical protein
VKLLAATKPYHFIIVMAPHAIANYPVSPQRNATQKYFFELERGQSRSGPVKRAGNRKPHIVAAQMQVLSGNLDQALNKALL